MGSGEATLPQWRRAFRADDCRTASAVPREKAATLPERERSCAYSAGTGGAVQATIALLPPRYIGTRGGMGTVPPYPMVPRVPWYPGYTTPSRTYPAVYRCPRCVQRTADTLWAQPAPGCLGSQGGGGRLRPTIATATVLRTRSSGPLRADPG